MQRVAFREAFDGGDGFLVRITDGRDAGCNTLAIDQHRAGTALAFTAAVFGARELAFFAQNIEQRTLGVGRHRPRLAVQCEGNVHSANRARLRVKPAEL